MSEARINRWRYRVNHSQTPARELFLSALIFQKKIIQLLLGYYSGCGSTVELSYPVKALSLLRSHPTVQKVKFALQPNGQIQQRALRPRDTSAILHHDHFPRCFMVKPPQKTRMNSTKHVLKYLASNWLEKHFIWTYRMSRQYFSYQLHLKISCVLI